MEQGQRLLGSGVKYFFIFTTHPDTKIPVTLAGTPSLGANLNGGSEVTAGLTLSVDHGGITGRHRVAFDVDDATLALANGDDFDIYVKQGTVGGYSVAGAPIASYEITDGSLVTETINDIETAISSAGLAEAADLAALQTTATAIESVTDHLADTLEDDGGTYRFTTNALEQAPTGSGGGGGLDAAGVRAAVGLASADLDAQLAALPTAAENATQVRTELTTELGRIDAAVSTRATPAQVATELATYDAPTKAELDAAVAPLATAAALTTVDAVVDAIKTKTDNLPTDPADQSLVIAATDALATAIAALPTAAANATQVRTELATELARLDAAVSTRLATAGYTAPLDGAAIRAALGMAVADLDTQLDALLAAIVALPNGAAIATALLDAADAIETGVTPRGALRAILAMVAGEVEDAETASPTISNPAGDTERVTMTTDINGNRSAVTLNV